MPSKRFVVRTFELRRAALRTASRFYLALRPASPWWLVGGALLSLAIAGAGLWLDASRWVSRRGLRVLEARELRIGVLGVFAAEELPVFLVRPRPFGLEPHEELVGRPE